MTGSPRLPWLLAAAVLLLGACTTVGPDFKRPDAPAGAAGYTPPGEAKAAIVQLSPEARTAGPWWQAFRSDALDRTVRLALAESPDVAEAQATLERYQAEAREAEGDRGLQVEGTGNAARQKFNSKSFGIKSGSTNSPFSSFGTRTFNLFSLGARVTYDLDLFGGERRRGEETGARVEQAARQADAAYLTLSASVALQAMRIAGLRDEIKAMEAIVEDDRTLLGLARKALGIGGIPRTTLTGIEAQLAEDEAVIPPLRRQYDTARRQMALLVGRSPADWAPPEFELAQMTVPAQIPVSLPSELVRRRPDILAAEADLHAATAAIGVRTADQYPAIRLSANGSLSGLTPDDVFSTSSTGYTLASGLTAPLFDGGARKARTRAAEAQARVSQARYRRTVLKAFKEVSDAMAALRTDEEEIASLTRAVGHSQQLADDTLAAARLGARTAAEVIQSRRQLDRDLRSLAEARARRLSDIVTLYAAAGADWRGAQSAGGGDGLSPGR
ncbi:efflux transporter outer membrane subunit [Phenylobacterium sp.]|uniref:efflux transporter outer membrane subunit n=1 Tax=Phenylobacterium sp. TaxID=1871053 RepID=UPI0025EB5B20|nr:efflux transporter outer membrane subunit [Phenylobacterium sp.]MBX3483282.1 efflux transporter outer membrane subunit [Phenylobacterium sp.]MCW5758468.1 efflux transporter outer membrane subunit [Phenylobacterium sp.]